VENEKHLFFMSLYFVVVVILVTGSFAAARFNIFADFVYFSLC
jgi:hypothetical protein